MAELPEARQGMIRAGLDALPYARTLGVRAEFPDGRLRLVLPFRDTNIGNPLLPALHGGAVGGFMELCAVVGLMSEMDRLRQSNGQPKPIGISVDYLRRGRPEDTFAAATVARMGARVANVRVEAWQSDPAKPVATLHGHFLLPPR